MSRISGCDHFGFLVLKLAEECIAEKSASRLSKECTNSSVVKPNSTLDTKKTNYIPKKKQKNKNCTIL